jgi:protein phosphatase
MPIEVGDTFLLCSDGLTGRVTDEELAPILKNLPPAEAGHLLIDLANLRGGPDNITVIIAKMVGEDAPADRPEPLKIGAKKRSPVQPAFWVCFAVCLLGAIVLALTENPVPALLAGCGALVALLLGLVAHFRGRATGVALSGGRRLGEGPYTETECSPDNEAVDLLRGITEELRSAGSEDRRSIDWDQYDNFCNAARQAENARMYTNAMRDYSRAIRHLMHEVRDKQNQQASDSTIDY